jgi:acetyl-CoA acetyltransferase
MHAAAAIACGLATTGRLSPGAEPRLPASRPWSQERVLVRTTRRSTRRGDSSVPVDVIGMWAHRHMYEFGTKREHFGNVAIAARSTRTGTRSP